MVECNQLQIEQGECYPIRTPLSNIQIEKLVVLNIAQYVALLLRK